MRTDAASFVDYWRKVRGRTMRVLDLLPPQQGEFTKEDGEPVVDSAGRRIGIA